MYGHLEANDWTVCTVYTVVVEALSTYYRSYLRISSTHRTASDVILWSGGLDPSNGFFL